MRFTQRDIAKKLNLSQSLVTGVLNSSPGVWASDETRRRIFQAARDLNYQPHAAARALRSGKTGIVGCVIIGSIGYHPVIEVLADSLAEIGYDLLVKVISHPEQAQARLGPLISGGVCDAIVFWGEEHDTEPLALQAAASGLPFVVKGRFEESHPDWLQIDFDHEGMMRQSVAHLVSLGHRRIGYFGYGTDAIYVHRLFMGFEEGTQPLFEGAACTRFVRLLASGYPAAEAAMDAWQELSPEARPTAIVIGTELSTWQGIERWLARRGQRIGNEPGDFALAGAAGNEAPLLYGDASAILNAELLTLAVELGGCILPAMLARKTLESSIVRLLPPLQPLRSLKLPMPF